MNLLSRFPLLKSLLAYKPTRSGKVLLFILKMGISLYILWRIAGKVSFGGAFATIFHLPPMLLISVMLISVLRHGGQYVNWLCALRVNPDFHESKVVVLKSYLLGLPLRFAIPGGHANMAKIFYIRNSSRLASLYSTMLERGMLTWASWTFASWAAVFYYVQYSPFWFILAFALCILFPELLYLALGSKPQWQHLKQPYMRQMTWMIMLQVFSTLLAYLQYWLLLRRFVPLPFLESSIRMALTQFSNTIPITIGGLGLREGFAIHFLKDTGITAQQAVSATLSLFLIHDVLTALIGLPFLIKAKTRPTGALEK